MRQRLSFQFHRLASLMLFALLMFGCGATAREKVLGTTLAVTNSARDGFVTFDAGHQQQIVEVAKTADEGKAALASYRHDRERVVVLFEGVYQAILAATLVNEDPKSMTQIVEAVRALRVALDAIMKGASS